MDTTALLVIDIHAHIVPYCERLTNDREFINVVSNAAFAVAVVICWPIARRVKLKLHNHSHSLPNGSRPMLLAIFCLPLFIAAGSALFHASPTHMTHMLDIVPVCLFAVLAVLLFMRLNGTTGIRIVATLLCWIVATAFAAQWSEVLAHSLFYFPTVVLLFVLALPTSSGSEKSGAKPGERRLLLGVATTFALALIFRALDLELCQLEAGATGIDQQYGTHWLWHLLTAVTCALGLQLVYQMTLKRI